MTTHDSRIARLEDRIRRRQCRTCWGHPSAIVHVPQGADASAPEYNPVECRECGRPLRFITHIIGISEDEFVNGIGKKAG